jgi:polyisoprenoid-binding protein YceI
MSRVDAMTVTLEPAPTPAPSPPSPPPRRRRRRRWRAAIVALVVALGLSGAGVWYFFRGDAPASVALSTATEAIDESTAGDTTNDAVTGEAADIEGTWTVDTSVGEFSYEESTGTFVGFRIDEELASIGSTTAVGRTPDVSGTVTIEGTTVTAATIEADMSTITTNDNRRDDRVLDALETSEYPTATFTLTEPIELGGAAAGGEAVTVDAVGELTIHGVTTTVTIPLQAQLVDGAIVIVGSIDISLADYGVSVPSAPIVVSAEDTATLELQLFLQQA